MIPKEEAKLLKASADCLFIWHISMEGAFCPMEPGLFSMYFAFKIFEIAILNAVYWDLL